MPTLFIQTFLKKYHLSILIFILTSSFIIKYLYVFYFTDYTHFLYSDMQGYWNRAFSSLRGDDASMDQWFQWPPFAHITLAWFFKFLYIIGFFEQKLQATLFMNILLSSFSTFFIYLIAKKLTSSLIYPLVSTFIYAFFFPLIYMNAFILSEHLSIFVVLFSIVLLFYTNLENKITLFIIGIVLAFSVAIRPSFGILGLSFFLYIFFVSKKTLFNKILNSLIFTIGFILFLFNVSINNYYNSQGKVKTLSAHGGLTFYFSQCEKYKVQYNSNSFHLYIIPPKTSRQPELGTLNTQIPFYEQSHYFKLGLDCIQKADSTIWIKKLYNLKYLYMDALFPDDNRAKYQKTLFPIFNMLALILTLILFFYPILYKEKNISQSKVNFLFSVLFTQVIILYFFNIEQRYLFGFFFVIVLLSPLIIMNIRKHTVIFLTLFFLYVTFLSYYFWQKPEVKKPIQMNISQNKHKLFKINQKREIIQTFSDKITTINFKTTEGLVHNDLGRYNFNKNIFIDFTTSLQLYNDQKITFIIASDDGFILSLDKENIFSFISNRAVSYNKKNISLTKGIHKLKINYHQSDGPMAIRAYYEIKGKRYFIGEDSPYVKFK